MFQRAGGVSGVLSEVLESTVLVSARTGSGLDLSPEAHG
jgi:hypothetical protein